MPHFSPPASRIFQLPFLQALPIPEPGKPIYAKRIGSDFDAEWIRGARELRRKEMTRPPGDFHIVVDLAHQEGNPFEGRTLDLADWEKDIIMTSL
jgi:hypothetical protein